MWPGIGTENRLCTVEKEYLVIAVIVFMGILYPSPSERSATRLVVST